MSHHSAPHSNICGCVLTSVTPSPARPHLVCQRKIQSERKSMENKGKNTEQWRAEMPCRDRGFVSYSSDLTPTSPSPNMSTELPAHINISLLNVSAQQPKHTPFSDTHLPTGLGCYCMPVILVYSDAKGWCGSTGSRGAVSLI